MNPYKMNSTSDTKTESVGAEDSSAKRGCCGGDDDPEKQAEVDLQKTTTTTQSFRTATISTISQQCVPSGDESCVPSSSQHCIPNGDGTCIPLAFPDSCAPLPGDTPTSLKEERIRKLAAECVGTCLLVMIVVGSGISATNLSNDVGVQLLINAIATMAGLYGLISIFGPVSGAHFNPCVSFVDTLHKDMTFTDLGLYTVVQCIGGILGSVIANLIYDHPQGISTTERFAYNLWISEVLSTATLLLIIHGCIRTGSEQVVPVAVSLWVGGGYFFTSSTIFANPAVTIGRMFSDSFAGIQPKSAVVYIFCQIIGALVGYGLVRLFYRKPLKAPKQDDVLYQRACLLVHRNFIDKKSY